MNPIKKFFQNFTKAKVISEPIDFRDPEGWARIGGTSTYQYYKHNDYENAYPSISKIANGFLSIQPYGIDEDGNTVKQNNAIDRLYFPNQQMSAVDFREALAVMSLVHDRVFIRVHHTGNVSPRGIRPESITGYTFIENCHPVLTEGKWLFTLQSGETLDDQEVMTLKDINPYALDYGFSPTKAAKKWIRIDDYIADYQGGFFRNGAVPAGMFIITAKTVTDYQDIKKRMQENHRGASKNNNVMYNYRPADFNGQKQDAQIEWVPFNTPNKDMSLHDLFEQANKKVDSSYGVPASIRGVNDQNTYASVRVDEQIFVNYTLRPRALKIWGKFTHELARITGGFGAAITFDLPTPQVADEEKVKSEAKQSDVNTLKILTEQGYTFDSSVEYIKTGDLSKLVMGDKPQIANTVNNDDQEEFDEGDEAADSPEQDYDATKTVSKQLSDKDRQSFESRLSAVIRARMRAQVEYIINNYDTITKAVNAEEPIDPKEDVKLAEEMIAVLLSAVFALGPQEQAQNLAIVFDAGIRTEDVGPFRMTAAQRNLYERYIVHVAAGYNAETSEKIREILRQGRFSGLSSQQIKDSIRSILTEEWRITRLAVSEVNRAGNESSLMSMQNIADETGAEVVKVWTHGGGDTPCEFCQAKIGTEIPLRDNFLGLGEEIHGVDGGILKNDFVPEQIAYAHPHDHCYITYRVVRSEL